MDTDFRICCFFLSAGLWQQTNKRQLSTDSLSIVGENKECGGGWDVDANKKQWTTGDWVSSEFILQPCIRLEKQKKDFGVNIDDLAIATQGARIGLYA